MVTALSVVGLRKRYGPVVAVDGVDLAVAEGEIFGILGPNGSGKTTTVECAQGLRKADGGTVRVFGIDSQAHPERAGRLVGIQLQHSELPDRIKVREALHLFASLSHDPADEGELLAQWDLSGKRRATFASLSGGQRQRLLVALALVTRPRLVFLDEMTTGLDPSARRDAWQVIEQVRRQGTTVVLVTHFMDEAERLCDRVCVLVNGTVVAQDSPAGLVANHGGDTRVRFHAPADLCGADLRPLPGVSAVDQVDGRIEVRGRGAFLTALGASLSERGFIDTVLSVHQPSLEDVYLGLVSSVESATGDGHARSGVDRAAHAVPAEGRS